MTRYRRLRLKRCVRMCAVFAAVALGILMAAGSGLWAAPKPHDQGAQSAAGAYISDLGGNVKDAGDHYNISGTNVTVRMYVKKSWPSALCNCFASLGSQLLAEPLDMRMNPDCDGIGLLFATDSAGNWCSESEKGYVKFPTTRQLPSGIEGALTISTVPSGHSALSSNALDKPVRLYNKAYVLSNMTLAYGSTSANYVHAKCEEMKHTASPIEADNESHDRATILDNVGTYTVFYMITHAYHEGQTYFIDCLNYCGPLEVVLAASVKARVDEKDAQPAYNLVHLDACYSAESKDMAEAFGVLDGSWNARPNRAYIGWIGATYGTLENLHWTQYVWDRLAAGGTVRQAVDEANDNTYEAGTARILGDRNTTLHAVYCGVIDPAP